MPLGRFFGGITQEKPKKSKIPFFHFEPFLLVAFFVQNLKTKGKEAQGVYVFLNHCGLCQR